MKVTFPPVKGSKKSSGSSGAPSESPNTLLSVQTAKLVEVLCAGPIKGLVDGAKSTYVDRTPVQNIDDTYNFNGFAVHLNLGDSSQAALPGYNGVVTLYEGPNVEITASSLNSIRTVTGTDIDEIRVSILCPQFTSQDQTTGALNGSTAGYIVEVRPYNMSAVIVVRNPCDMATANRNIGCASLVAGDSVLVGSEVVASGIPSGTTCTAVNVNVNPALSFFSVSKDPTTTNASLSVTFRQYNANWKIAKQGTITGKCTSPYTFEVPILLTSESSVYGTGPWQVRVRRTTPDSVSAATINKIYWSLYAEVKYTKLRYPKVAHIGYSFDAKTFNNVPETINHLDLKLIRIPANYDPYARTYASSGPGTTAGVWNGTFKTDWSNNPAWVYYDLCIDVVDGLGDYLPASSIDKYELYSIAQYCDGSVPDGRGGFEPRMTCNLLLQTQEQAIKVLANLASVFRGISYWSSSTVRFAQDRSGMTPIDVFGPANVRNGNFVYAGTPANTRTNRVVSYYNDPDNFSESTPLLVEDDDLITANGVIEKSIVNFGGSSPGQARRAARAMIYSDNYEAELVQFDTAGRANRLELGQLVFISDPVRAVERLFGRLTASAGTTVTLDAGVEIISGKTYTLYCVSQNGGLLSRSITNAPVSSATVITFTPDLVGSDIPLIGGVWAVSISDNVPAIYKVLSCTSAEKPWFRITAVKYNESKHNYIDFDTPLEFPPDSPLVGAAYVAPPTNLTLTTQYVSVPENTERRITASWTHSGDLRLSYYRVSYRLANGEWTDAGDTSANSISFGILVEGTYTVRVIAFSTLERPSASLTGSIVIVEDPLANGTITGLGLEGGGAEFFGANAVFVWSFTPGINSPDTVSETDIANNPFLKGYRVRIYSSAAPSTLLYSSIETEPYFDFDYELNYRISSGAPFRSVIVKVAAVSLRDNVSAEASFTATNPTPLLGVSPPTHDAAKFVISAQGSLVQFEYVAPTSPDFSGLAVWVSTSPSWALTAIRLTDGALPESAALVPYEPVGNTGMLLYLGTDTKVQAILKAGTFYFAYALLDTFGFAGAKCYGPVSQVLGSSSGAQFVTLVANDTAFTRANSLATFAPATILLTATPFGYGTPTYSWDYLDTDGVTWLTLAGTGSTQTIAFGSFAGSSQGYRVTATEGVVSRSDTITLYKVTGGDNSITAYLTNEAHTVPAGSTGIVSSWSGASGTFKVFNGATDVTGSSTFSIVSNPDAVTGSFTGANYSFTASGSLSNATNVTSITLRAVYAGTDYDKVFTVTKSLAGVAGSSGNDGYSFSLTMESAIVQCDSAGSAKAGELGGGGRVSTSFSAKRGPTALTATGSAPGAGQFRVLRIADTNCATTYSGGFQIELNTVSALTGDSEYKIELEGTATFVQSKWHWIKALDGIAGGAGTAGLNNATVTIYKRSATSPTLPSATATYTFSPAGITGLNNGWDRGFPIVSGDPVWASAATASSNTSNDTIASGEWATPIQILVDGADGVDAYNTAPIYLYQRAASLPSVPAGTTTYTFVTSVLSGSLGSWTQTVPGGTDPLYITTATAFAVSTATTDTILTGEWAAPQIFAQNGAPGPTGSTGPTGANGFYRVRIYQSSATVPSTPSAVNSPAGWTTTVPAVVANQAIYISEAYFNGATDNISGTWSTPTRLPGTLTFYAAAFPTGIIVAGDFCFRTDLENELYRYDGSTWVQVSQKVYADDFGTNVRPVQLISSNPGLPNGTYPVGSVIFNTTDGKLYRNLANVWTAAVPTSDLSGTIAAGQIAANAVTAGTIAANAVTAGTIAAGVVTATTVGANQIIASSANIANAVITNAHIVTLDAGKLTAGTINAIISLTTGGEFRAGTGDSQLSASPTGTTIGNTANRHVAFPTTTSGTTAFQAKNGATSYVEVGAYSLGGGTFGGLITVSNSAGQTTSYGVGIALAGTIIIGGDTNLYRSAANTLKTDDAFVMAGAGFSGLNGAGTDFEFQWTTGSAVDVKGVNFRVYNGATQTALIDRLTGDYYRQTVKILGAQEPGWTAPTGATARGDFVPGTITLVDLAEQVNALKHDLHASAGHGLLGA